MSNFPRKQDNASGSDFQSFISAFYWKTGKAQDIGKRAEQQDSIGIQLANSENTNALLAVLADGMGGMHDGAEFSRIAVETHMESFQSALNSYQKPENILLSLALQANSNANRIYDEAEPGGTTLLSVLFLDKKQNESGHLLKKEVGIEQKEYSRFYFLSVGDSRIYLLRDKKLLQLNREHVLSAKLDERAWFGFISLEDAEGNMYRNSLTACIGEDRIRTVDVSNSPTKFMSGDKLILMSDGIFRELSEAELVGDLSFPPQEAAEKIVSHIKEKADPNQDNMSIIIIEKV